MTTKKNDDTGKMHNGVQKQCGCRGPDGRRLGRRCPRLKQTTHGSWTFMLDLDAGPDGRRQVRRSGFTTSTDAKAARAKMLADRRAGSLAETRGLTVGAWLEEWLAGRVNLRPSTRLEHTGAIRLYLAPGIGHVHLDKLRTGDVEQLYAAMRTLGGPTPVGVDGDTVARLVDARRGWAKLDVHRPGPATIARVHAVLRAALNGAVRRRMIPTNPAVHVELEAAQRPDVHVWSPEDAAAFLDAQGDDRLYALWHLAIAAGLRRGELCGLRWEDVHLDEPAFLRVARQLTQVGKAVLAGEPKTRAGARALSLDAGTVRVLREHRRRQVAEQLAWGGAYHDGGLVFAAEDGSPLRPASLSQRFAHLVARLGLPPVHLHSLRHTSASLRMAAGETMKEISDRLGHSQIGVTANIYAHVMPSVASASAERRAALVGTHRTTPLRAETGAM